MWVEPGQLRELASALRTAHQALVEPVPAVAAAVDAAAWECGAGDEHRHQVGVVLRRVQDAGAVLAACAVGADHVATQAEALLTAMRKARAAQVGDIRELMRQQTADGGNPGAFRAELNSIPGVPDLAWLPSVPAPIPPVLDVAGASALLPDRASPGGRFSVKIDSLDAVPATLETAADAVSTARAK